MRIIIVGAGISGLAAANRLSELGKEKSININFNVLESSDHPGGNICTIKEDGFLIEEGPDSFITSKPYGLNLCNRLGIGDEVIPTSEINRKTLIFLNRKLTPIPEGFILLAPTRIKPFIVSPILSFSGKMRAMLEIFIPRSNSGDEESLYSFIKRRFGRELFENIAQPLIGGIYTSDPYKLSIKSAVPEIYKLEQRYRSVIIGMIKGHRTKKDSGARYSQFVTLKNGMSSLISSIASRIPDGSIITGQTVKNIQKNGDRWKINSTTGEEYEADGVILSTASYRSAEILNSLDKEISTELQKIIFASSAIVILAYKKEQINQSISGFGFVVPSKENLNLIACSFSSEKFKGRAPENLILTRSFVGGALNEKFLEKSDNEIISTIKNELAKILSITGEPLYTRIKRYPRSMPQYNLGHEIIINNLKNMISKHKTLKICGNSYEGIGIPDCIRSGESAAEDIVDDIMKNINSVSQTHN